MEQVAKRGRGVSLLGDFQKASGYGPRQRALGGPASVGGAGLDDFQKSFLT